MQFTVLFFIGSILLSYVLYDNVTFITIGILTLLGFLLDKVLKLQKDLNALQTTLIQNSPKKSTAIEHPVIPNSPAIVSEKQSSHAPHQTVSSTNKSQNTQPIADSNPRKIQHVNSAPITQNALFVKATEIIKNYFTAGNLFVRIGIIILFFGISFLLKYVSEQGFFPIEYRLIGVALGAIALLGLGWRLREKNETYGLLLQGAGIGVLYLNIYAAFGQYQLLPPIAAFALLFVVSLLSAALAVIQDSKSLAILGFSGGFLAPVLASSGSNNHIGLFSYYGVLNLAIVAIAWFKAWRPLNLLGFAFTFIIATVWGVTSYNSEKFASTEPFLILFFLFYVLIAVLFSLRQPPNLRGYVDGTLLFGVPLAASSLQYLLVKEFDYGMSLSFFIMGAFYLLLSNFIWKRKREDLKLLAEAFLILGVIFASMAIPFALSPTQTAAAWALEGAGLLWLGTRQNRLSVRFFGLILQAGAGFVFLSRYAPYWMETTEKTLANTTPFINGTFIGCLMLVIAGIISARLLIKPFKGQQNREKRISPILLIWGLVWLFGGFIYQIIAHYSINVLPTSLLLLTALTSFMFTLFAIRFKPEWKEAWAVASFLFAFVLFLALVQIIFGAWSSSYHPLQQLGWIAWPVVMIVYYFLLKKLEQHQTLQRIQPLFHSALLLLFVALVTFEGAWLLKQFFSPPSDWITIWYIIPTILTLHLITSATFWPFSAHKKVDIQQASIVLAILMLLWTLASLSSQSIPAPLAWIPFFNPLDIVLTIIVITLLNWWKALNNHFSYLKIQHEKSFSINQILIISLAFLWINVTLFRIAHHWFDVAYQPEALYQSSLVQTAVSILWAFFGVIITVYASRKKVRFLWIGGAALLGLVVLKLFIIDLSTLSNLARIISFMVVGVLLMSIGYFAPLPEKTSLIKEHDKTTRKDPEND